MNIYAKLAAAAVVVVAVGALGVWFLSPGSSSAPVGGAPASSAGPTPSPSPSPEPSAVPSSGSDCTATVRELHLDTARDLAGNAVRMDRRSLRRRPGRGHLPNYGDPSVDLIYDPVHTGELWLMVASLPLDAADPDQWPADQFAGLECPVTVPLSVDGATGLIGADFSRTDCSVVFVTAGGRGYQIRLYNSIDEDAFDRGWFDEVLATVDLRPEDAVD